MVVINKTNAKITFFIIICLLKSKVFVIIKFMMLLLLGLLSWIILEYILHRFVLHKEPINKSHKYHHDIPADDSNLVIPLIVSIPITLAYCSIALLLFSFVQVFFLVLGLLAGYVFYEYVHYTIHQSKPKSKLMRYLRKHHYLHHFKYPDKN